jgi:hypothetical protein
VVRSRIADLALVPAVYPTLLRQRSLGELFFSKPVATIPVALFYLNAKSGDLAPIIESVRKGLKEFPREAPIRMEARRSIPRVEECKTLKFGYYIDIYRGGVACDDEDHIFKWRCETFEWERREGSTLVGTITNIHKDTFSAVLERTSAALILKATAIFNEGKSVRDFVSVFSVAASFPTVLNAFIVLGTWTTIDRGIASSYGTVLSNKALSLKDLRQLQMAINFRSILSAQDAVDFETQTGGDG